MTAIQMKPAPTVGADAIVAVAERLGPSFTARAEAADENDRFVAESFAELKQAGLIEAGVPRELGGGGGDVDELCEMLRVIARHCGSTALAFAMHTHQVAIPAWRWRHQKIAAVEPLLKRVAAERIVLLSSGGSDWIAGSGEAEKVDGGYKITARKIFSSAAPVGDLLMTGAVLAGEDGPQALHFGIPMNSPHVKILDTWRTLGMRGTGSHDVLIEGHVVPEGAVAVKRPAGEWHPIFQVIATIAFPLIYSVYLGVAESAGEIALDLAKRRRPDRRAVEQIGRMETHLAGARLAQGMMLRAVNRSQPSASSVNEVMIGRALLASHALAAVEAAMEAAGGAGFYRAQGLERRFRDIQGARYHPLQPGPQAEYAGAIALGLPTDRIF